MFSDPSSLVCRKNTKHCTHCTTRLGLHNWTIQWVLWSLPVFHVNLLLDSSESFCIVFIFLMFFFHQINAHDLAACAAWLSNRLSHTGTQICKQQNGSRIVLRKYGHAPKTRPTKCLLLCAPMIMYCTTVGFYFWCKFMFLKWIWSLSYVWQHACNNTKSQRNSL